MASTDELKAALRERGMDWETFKVMMDSITEPPRPMAPVPRSSAPAQFSPNARGASLRLNAQRIQILLRNPFGLDDLCPANTADKTTCFVRSNVCKAIAERQWDTKKYSDARATYIRAASEMVATHLPLSDQVRTEVYTALAGWDGVDLMGCINGIIDCSRKLCDYATALRWLEEADTLKLNLDIARNLISPAFEWTRGEISSPDYYFERITTLCLASDVFLSMGNTASAVHRRWLADEILADLPAHLKTPQTMKLTPLLGSDILRLRHPDPKSASALTVEQPGLQMCGSWQKLSIGKAGSLPARMRGAVFAFGGQLYVLGGEKSTTGPWYRDFWALDLEKLDGWRQLPDFPLPKAVTDDLVGYHLVPHRDGRAFVFTGIPALPVFDTKRRKWSVMHTTFVPDALAPEWPYSTRKLIEYTAQCVGDRLYVFGGIHPTSMIGTDLLMELHIPSRKWRRLSGTAVPVPSVTGPGPREQCHSWVAKDNARIFFMFGEADRQAAMIHKQAHAGFYSYGYGDLWSWDIQAAAWTQERLRGNVPSPRSEMSCTYSAALDKVIIFGGYSPTVPTRFDDIEDIVTYSYYADTFIGDMSASSSSSSSSTERPPIPWKQVLTRGFPTYRADATLVTDTQTGKVFLFGGYKNTTYVRSKNAAPSGARSFVDLWQLRLDVPGGWFAGVDLEEEKRTAKAGPWQRCFACGSAGPWKRCGGTCDGRVFFCDSECLKEGWKEHKEMHNCGKA
ncbi:hypothetical protein B0H17DRAFT_1333769 [Mycena rosella]|uniref:Uncharacterized protein n=1 Tax=Mycena rosella TaxID=1033263 RepID=A0AAD7D625_MYCRO|nr:hypothetical protein B0H17DRAFT_1333769 [Mycena rosella]